MNAQTQTAPRAGNASAATPQPASRGELATVEQGRAPTKFEQELAAYEPQIAAALPSHIKPERFRRVVITAINQNPDLLAADRRSLFNACVKAANQGLLPDGEDGALVIYNTKVKRDGKDVWIKLVQWMPMYRGLIKRVRNTGDLASISAHVVYENDGFEYVLGDEERIVHQPHIGADRGAPVGAYAIAKLTDGTVQREFMPAADIERARSMSKSSDGPAWKNWWDQMARKCAIRRLSKYLPASSELDRALAEDESLQQIEHRPQAALPPRPQRGDYGALPEPAAATDETPADGPDEVDLINAVGEVIASTGDADVWAEKFEAEVSGCAVAKALETLWDNNKDAIATLPDALATRVRDAYAAREAEIGRADRAALDQDKPEGGGAAVPQQEPDQHGIDWKARKEALLKHAQSFGARKPLLDWFGTDAGVAALKQHAKPLYDELMTAVNARQRGMRK